MAESPVEVLTSMSRTLQNEIYTLEGEKLNIFKRIQAISQELEQLDKQLASATEKKEGLDEVVTETSKGFRRVEVTVHSLLSLVLKQSKVLKRLAVKARSD
jgi:predicted  nucleic acid-binding Zn-ribbon protein